MKQVKPVYYSEYLGLDKILDAQKPLSGKDGEFAHDEMLFIIIHQTYELWFKQIIFEFEWIRGQFQAEKMDDKMMADINQKLKRCSEILKVLVQQISVIETMTAPDFLEFRDYLIPASGFQSIQFRLVETLLGRKFNDRVKIERDFLRTRLNQHDFSALLEENEKPSLHYHINQWLDRFPIIEDTGHQFWKDYEKSVQQMLKKEEEIIKRQSFLDSAQQEFELRNLDSTKKHFSYLFDASLYRDLLDSRQKNLSQKATLTAIFISLYRNQPLLQQPFLMLEQLKEIDQLLGSWRHRHVFMAHRLLGSKVGTGGSSGHDYLKKVADKNRVFQDLFDISSYLLPKSEIPKLPADIMQNLSFVFK